MLYTFNNTCLPNIVKAQVKAYIAHVRKRVREETNKQISRIYTEQITPLFNCDYEFITTMVVLCSVRSSLYKIKKQCL